MGYFLGVKSLDSADKSEGRVDGSGDVADGGEQANAETLKETLKRKVRYRNNSLKVKLESMEIRMKGIWLSSCV